jgi:hypothetical protein
MEEICKEKEKRRCVGRLTSSASYASRMICIREIPRMVGLDNLLARRKAIVFASEVWLRIVECRELARQGSSIWSGFMEDAKEGDAREEWGWGGHGRGQ